MSLLSSQVTIVASTFTALNAVCPSGWTKLSVSNASTTIPIYVGPSGVTVANGYFIAAPGKDVFEIPPGDVLFGASTANTTAYVLRSSLST